MPIQTEEIGFKPDEMSKVPLTLNVIVGNSPERVENSEIWQDSGDGFGYKLNEWRPNKVEHKPGLVRLTRFGSYNGQKIGLTEALGVSKQSSEMRIDGKIVEKMEIDENRLRLRISLEENASEITMKR